MTDLSTTRVIGARAQIGVFLFGDPTVAVNPVFPATSVDHLIERNLPQWLIRAEAEHARAYHQALLAQQGYAERLRQLLEPVPSIEAFALPRLQRALNEAGLAHVDPRQAFVSINERFELPSAAEKLYQPAATYTSRHSLLAAALHNFQDHETRPWLLRSARLVGAKGAVLALPFERFASICRSLDIGAGYQAVLKSVLQPKSGRGQPWDQARRHVEQLFQDCLRARLKAEVYEARIKRQIDEADLQRLLAYLAGTEERVEAKGSFTARQLYLLGKCIVGVIALEWRAAGRDEIDEIIVWMPGDPDKAIRHYDCWSDVYEDIAIRLRVPTFRSWFSRFIKARDSAGFNQALTRLLKAPAAPAVVELDGRNLPITGHAVAHVQAQQVARIFDDARFIAVPTDDEDRQSRQERLQQMLSAGLDLLGMAAFFVPGLGELLLVVNAVQLLDEVYEGYQAWQLGDRQGALNHLFGVVESVALAGALSGVVHVLPRIAFVDALEPGMAADGTVKLRHRSLRAHLEESPAVLLQALAPQAFGSVLEDDARTLLTVTGFNADKVRRLCVEHAPAPARILDMHERIALHHASPGLKGAAFEEALGGLRQATDPDQAVLMAAFKGLTPRGAEEIIRHTCSAQLENWRANGRVPLGMAERARAHVRQTRLDNACLGVRLHGMGSPDSERLVMGLLAHKVPWPSTHPVELRSGSREGPLLFASHAEPAAKPRLIVRHEQGYRLYDSDGSLDVGAGESLLKVLVLCLDDEQKAVLNSTSLNARQLRDWLMASIAADREQAGRLIGAAPSGAAIHPPRRFGDGRLGYRLSGGGESSQQAIRRGIHQIFPTLSELQLQAYLNAVRAQGHNLWDHYQLLQRQLAELRGALSEWQGQWRTPADAIRRRRVADTLRRSWRRKLVDVNDEYELVLDGEHVSELPTLPAGLEFAHVHRLVLRNMGLESIAPDFLGRFPNLVELDLSENRLTQVPPGIEGLTHLRRLNLTSNQIVIDEQANRRFAPLALLDTVELSFNPLGQAPDLSGLRHVRQLHLRATELVDVEELLSRASWRAMIDARENRIRQLQQEMQGLDLRLARVQLHDNPLNQTSHQQLDLRRAGAAPGARGSASYKHREANAEVRELWTQTRDRVLRLQREATWDRLRQEAGSSDLFRFLADLGQGDDFVEHPGHFRRRVWRILDACEHNEVLREQVFREVGGPRSCEDRLLLMLNQMEIGVLVQQGVSGVPANQVEQSLVRLGRQLYRLDLVDSIATRHVQHLRANTSGRVDEIEVRLLYRNRLAQALELPVQVEDMHYAQYANVTDDDLLEAQLDVLQAETPEEIQQTLAQRPFWASYARRRYAERFDALVEPYHQRLAEHEAQAASGGEQLYLQRADELMRELEVAEQRLLRTLAEEAWARFTD